MNKEISRRRKSKGKALEMVKTTDKAERETRRQLKKTGLW